MTRTAAALLVLTLLAGCVASPTALDLSEPPNSGARAADDGMAEIVVFRGQDNVYTAVNGIWINEEKIGRIYIRDYVHTLVPPGEVQVVATAEARSWVKFPAEAGRAYYLKAVPKAGWFSPRVQLQLVAPELGQRAIEGCGDKTGLSDMKRADK
jgi:hypothetical protein